jgi:flagellar basal-body rod protein FlgF
MAIAVHWNRRRHMDSLTITAAAGLRSRIESFELLANNMANASTAGYKADRESYQLYQSEEASPEGARLPLVEKTWVDFSQGTLESTGNAKHVAIDGDGFLAAEGPRGPLLTRGGQLEVKPDGRVVTKEGYELMTVEPRRIRANPSLPLEVNAEGAVSQNGALLGRLKVVAAQRDAGLAKLPGGYFALDSQQLAKLPAAKGQVRQGFLEGSNANPAESAVRMVSLLRQFESLQKAIQLGAEMNRKVVEDVARVQP